MESENFEIRREQQEKEDNPNAMKRRKSYI
jgi:hypothetical protein